jgi:hypothetical protein
LRLRECWSPNTPPCGGKPRSGCGSPVVYCLEPGRSNRQCSSNRRWPNAAPPPPLSPPRGRVMPSPRQADNFLTPKLPIWQSAGGTCRTAVGTCPLFVYPVGAIDVEDLRDCEFLFASALGIDYFMLRGGSPLSTTSTKMFFATSALTSSWQVRSHSQWPIA